MKDRLFYSKNENILFLICGFDDKNPREMAKNLKLQSENFAKLAEVKEKAVSSIIVTEPSEYKDMRVFHTTTKNIPDVAIVLSAKAWTMMLFLTIPFKEYAIP